MGNPVEYLSPEHVSMSYGHIMQKQDHRFVVRTRRGVVIACKAAGCLIEPAAGDKVLISADHMNQGYILTVLERDESSPASINTQSGLSLNVNGRLNLKGIDIVAQAENDISLRSTDLGVATGQASLEIHDLSYSGKSVKTTLERFKSAIGTLDSKIGNAFERFGRYFRKTDELEDVEAGRLNCRVQETMLVRTGEAVITAEENVTIDGKKINLG